MRGTWPYPARMEPRSPLSDLKLRWGRSRRAFRAFFRLPGTKRFVAGLVLPLLLLVLATVLIHVRYRDPSADGAELGFPESLYAVFTMLFFGSAYPLPTDPLTLSRGPLVDRDLNQPVRRPLGSTVAATLRTRWMPPPPSPAAPR